MLLNLNQKREHRAGTGENKEVTRRICQVPWVSPVTLSQAGVGGEGESQTSCIRFPKLPLRTLC